MGVTMSTLLEEIENYDACAAAKLKEADFQTDSEIRTLTAADLHELFPGQEKLVLRKTIFDMIHKQGACQQQGNPGLIQQDALRNVVIAECFDRIKTMKDRLEERQAVLEVLKKKMKDIRREAEFQTDSLMQSLSREDLNEIFPGAEHLKLRRTIYEILHNQKQTHEFLKNLDDFIQQDCLDAAVVTEYLDRINNIKDQLDQMLTDFEAHVKRLKDVNKSQVSHKDPESGSGLPASSTKGETMSTLLQEIEKNNSNAASVLKEAGLQTDSEIRSLTPADLHELFPGSHNLNGRKSISEIIHKNSGYSSNSTAPSTTNQKQNTKLRGLFTLQWPKTAGLSQKPPVKCKMVVCGETFGAHRQLLEQIQTSGLNLMEGKDEERCITIVFCPVVSRIGTDAEAAMSMVPGDDPVILVFMHYSQEPGYVSSSRVLSSNPRVVSELHVFYHDRQHGLLRCEQNKNAVIELQKTLKQSQKF